MIVPLPTLPIGAAAEEVWRRYDAIESRLTAPVSERMLDVAGIELGMQVLDLATGRGEPALRAARRVGPTGHVLGVDPSEGLLRMAREAADREGLSNLDLRVANAEALEGVPRGQFHAVTCRWGLMYMGHPVAALMRARDALGPWGTLVAALWAEPERMPYYTVPRECLKADQQPPRPDPEAPGMFRYRSLGRIVRDFGEAGFKVDHVEEMDIPIFEADTVAAVVDYVRALGAGMGSLLSALSEQDQREWEAAFTSAMEQRRTEGVFRLGGVTRIVRARRK